MRQQLEEQSAQLCQLREEHNSILAERNTLLECVASEKSRYASLGDSHAALQRKSERFEAEIVSLSLGSNSLEKELQAFRDHSRVTDAKLAESEVLHDKSVAELERQTAAAAAAQQEISELRVRLGVSEAERATASARINALEQDLADTRGRANDLTTSNISLENAVTNLQETIGQLRDDHSKALMRISTSAAEAQEAEDALSQLRASHADALARAASSQCEVASLRRAVSDLESTLESTCSELKETTTKATQLRALMDEEQASHRRAESELVSIHDGHDRLVADMAEQSKVLATTLEQLEQARRDVGEAHLKISALEREREKEVAARVAENATLSSSLETCRAETQELTGQLRQAHDELVNASEKLQAVVAERDKLVVGLENADARVTELEGELKIALDDVQDAEEEIKELQQAKANDEASIMSLKDAYARLRQVQLSVLDEVGDKVRGNALLFARGKMRNVHYMD